MKNDAKITTPLMKRRNGVMTDYEYLFSMNLQAKLKEKIQGAIYVKVNKTTVWLLRSQDVMKIILICLLQIFQINSLMDFLQITQLMR